MTWQETQATLVSNEIDGLTASLSHVTDFYEIVREPVEGITRKKVSDVVRPKPWYLLPMVVCEAISGNYECAAPASASLQLFMAAGEVFDDVEDADSPNSLSARYGSAIATNAATTLLILAERAIARLKEKNVVDLNLALILNAINSFFTNACIGQHQDLSKNCHSDISEDDYLKIASTKSASTVECACHLGALIATANQELIDLSTRFGHNLGMASQIANDINGIVYGNDIAHKKVTLPVIYALSHTGSVTQNQLRVAFGRECKSQDDIIHVRDLLFQSGAIYYTTIKMEFYKQCAFDILTGLGKAGVSIERLRFFLE